MFSCHHGFLHLWGHHALCLAAGERPAARRDGIGIPPMWVYNGICNGIWVNYNDFTVLPHWNHGE